MVIGPLPGSVRGEGGDGPGDHADPLGFGDPDRRGHHRCSGDSATDFPGRQRYEQRPPRCAGCDQQCRGHEARALEQMAGADHRAG
ncbi:hypothetical protein GCM10010232_55700 [Streptomyces amakusaensis]